MCAGGLHSELDGIGRRRAVNAVHRCHLVLCSVRRRRFPVPVLDVLDRLRQRTVQRLRQEERQQSASN